MRRVLRLFVPFALLVPVVAGCGGDDNGGNGQTVSAVGILARAADATVAASTAKLSMVMELRGLPGQGDVTMTVDGAMDFERRLAAMTIDLGDLGAPVDGTMEMRLDGTTMYMKLPLPEAADELGGKPWIRYDLTEMAELTGVDITQQLNQSWNDPRQTLAFLEGVHGDIEEVGREEVRGVDTTHYRAVADLGKAAEESGAIVDRDRFDQFVDALDIDEVPVEVWVDGDNQVRRMRMDMPMPKELGDVTASMTMELFDLGGDVDIAPPPADQVTDFSSIMGDLGEY